MKHDPNQPVINEDGTIQLRMIALMLHPDYNLDKAYGGRGAIGPNRNEELEAMETIAIILDAKRRLEENIKAGKREAVTYGYATLMSDVYDRAVFHGHIADPSHDRAYYETNGLSYNGKDAMRRCENRITENEHTID